MHASCGILFNHESPRRGETFVTRKITRAVGRIKLGLQKKLFLGNLDAMRDWGFAGDYVEAMWRMLNTDEPDDYVIATGRTVSLEYFTEKVFQYHGLNWQNFVEIDHELFRPTDLLAMRADPSKARTVLGWSHKKDVDGVISGMCDVIHAKK
jgi:GDPmannose 4,6-dehydratase